ncbi:MAG: DUF3592 domain-containing protein [Motilibacteraceae bacterium]
MTGHRSSGLGWGWRLFQFALYVLGVAAVLFAVGLVWAFGRQVVDTLELDRHGVVTDAVVMSVDRAGSSRYPDVLHIRYRTSSGQTFTTTLNSQDHDAYAAGDSVSVEYDPAEPARIRRPGSHDLLALGLLTAVVLAALTQAAWLIRRRRRRARG